MNECDAVAGEQKERSCLRIDIRLGLPSSSLNPNNSKGRHWTVSRNARSSARLEAFVVAKQALSRSGRNGGASSADGNVGVEIAFHFPDNRPRDIDNLLAALKPSIDGISDAIGVNDRNFSPIQINRFHDGGSFVEISLFLNKRHHQRN